MEKIIFYLRYIFCVPLSFIAAIILSGAVSVLQNLFNAVSCKLAIALPFFIDCSGNYTQRTFLADIAFFYLFVELSRLIAPNYKKQISLGVLILCILFGLFVLTLSVIRLLFTENTLNVFAITVWLIIWAIIQYKEIKLDKVKME